MNDLANMHKRLTEIMDNMDDYSLDYVRGFTDAVELASRDLKEIVNETRRINTGIRDSMRHL